MASLSAHHSDHFTLHPQQANTSLPKPLPLRYAPCQARAARSRIVWHRHQRHTGARLEISSRSTPSPPLLLLDALRPHPRHTIASTRSHGSWTSAPESEMPCKVHRAHQRKHRLSDLNLLLLHRLTSALAIVYAFRGQAESFAICSTRSSFRTPPHRLRLLPTRDRISLHLLTQMIRPSSGRSMPSRTLNVAVQIWNAPVKPS